MVWTLDENGGRLVIYKTKSTRSETAGEKSKRKTGSTWNAAIKKTGKGRTWRHKGRKNKGKYNKKITQGS